MSAPRPAAQPRVRSPAGEVRFPGIFRVSSDTPDEVDPDSLKALVESLSACPGAIVVTGHTCSLGDPAYNRYLGRRRAESVKALLVAQGIPPERIRVRSAGSDRPVADNSTLQGRRRNRRVTLICSPEETASALPDQRNPRKERNP